MSKLRQNLQRAYKKEESMRKAMHFNLVRSQHHFRMLGAYKILQRYAFNKRHIEFRDRMIVARFKMRKNWRRMKNAVEMSLRERFDEYLER